MSDDHTRSPWLRLRGALAGLIMVTAAFAACSEDPGPAGRLDVQPAELRLAHGEARPVRLTFEPLRALDKVRGTPTVFVHLIDPRGDIVRTFDHALPSEWTAGVRQSYEIDVAHSALGEPLRAGTYTLAVGLYDDVYGYRWPMQTRGREEDRRQYVLGTVHVPAGEPAARFDFLGDWKAVEAGTSGQVPARRCLAGPAAIRVSGVAGKGSLELAVFLMPVPDGLAPAPLEVQGCGSGLRELRETRQHRLSIPWHGRQRDRICRIRFRPQDPARAACLESLTWKPTP